MTRKSWAIVLMLLAIPTARADFSKVVSAYQTLLSQPGAPSVAAGPLGDVISDAVANSPASDFAQAVPVVKQCLRSENPAVRREALILLMVYNTRPDSAQLLDPYVEDLIRMLDDAAPATTPYIPGQRWRQIQTPETTRPVRGPAPTRSFSLMQLARCSMARGARQTRPGACRITAHQGASRARTRRRRLVTSIPSTPPMRRAVHTLFQTTEIFSA